MFIRENSTELNFVYNSTELNFVYNSDDLTFDVQKTPDSIPIYNVHLDFIEIFGNIG